MKQLIKRLLDSRFLMATLSILAAVATVVAFGSTDRQLRVASALIVVAWILYVGVKVSLVGSEPPKPKLSEFVTRRLDVIDGVVAGMSRRPWDPTLVPVAGRAVDGAILVLPGASYHLPEMVSLGRELQRRGHRVIYGSGVPHFARNGDGLSWYPDIDFVQVDDGFPVEKMGVVVVMKDWAGYGEIIRRAKEAGIPTAAKVEGAQDFGDIENPGPPWRPYRHTDLVLCQGRNDFVALDGMKRTIVGSTRLERLRWAPPRTGSNPLAVVNYNFSYGVLIDEARGWLSSATSALRQAGVPYVVSSHPAVRIKSTVHPWTTIPISRLLPDATVLVSRFSTVPFEAMARGVPFVYHNPHGERIPTFHVPNGAFPVSEDPATLMEALKALPEPGEAARRATVDFFSEQVSMEEAPSEVRSADAVERWLLGHLGPLSG